ncbi:pheST operon leader peptide PheM [Yersinia pestis]|nr:pheST operon leader peptide PheM [Yersinia pestis]
MQLFFASFFTLAPDYRRLARKNRNEKIAPKPPIVEAFLFFTLRHRW